MACSFSTLKESGFLAPIAYYLLHAILLAAVIASTTIFRNLDDLPYVIAFWAVSLVTAGLYLSLRFKDPGFVPYDAIFFTDQDQGPMNRTHSKNMGSKVQLNPHHANASIQSDNAPSKIVEERISIQESHREKSLDAEQSLPPSLSELRFHEKSKSSIHKNNSPGSEEIPNDNISENKNGNINIPAQFHRDIDVVACEPSVEDEEPFDYNPGTITMDEDKENEEMDSVMNEHQRRLQAETSILGTLPNNIEERDGGSGSLNSTKPHDHYKSVTQFSHDIEAETKQFENNYPLKELINVNNVERRQEIFENSCDIQFQTGDDDENRRVNIEGIKIKAQRTAEVNAHRRQNSLNRNVILYKLQEKNFSSPKRETENACVHSVERVVTKENETGNKEIVNVCVEEPVKQENRDSTKIEVNETYKNVKEENGEVFFVERRYCIICNIEQPIRSKHCRTCNKCVARYDHHCPWIGTCIGEKNHQLFYWFIVFQVIELGWATTELIRNIVNDDSENWIAPNIGRIILVIILSGFFLFVASLFVFQTYLIFSNLTTWEKLSWNKITYMKEWNKKWGSPFSKGVGQNLLYFFLKSKKELRRWRLPKFAKDSNNQVKST